MLALTPIKCLCVHAGAAGARYAGSRKARFDRIPVRGGRLARSDAGRRAAGPHLRPLTRDALPTMVPAAAPASTCECDRKGDYGRGAWQSLSMLQPPIAGSAIISAAPSSSQQYPKTSFWSCAPLSLSLAWVLARRRLPLPKRLLPLPAQVRKQKCPRESRRTTQAAQ